MAFKTLSQNRKIALLIESSRSYGRRVLRGISRYAQTCGDWTLLHQEMTMGDQLPDWIGHSGVSGIIARVDTHNLAPLQELGLPIVDVLRSRSDLGIPQIETDDQRVAKMALDHLIDCGFRRFAFCGYRVAHYSQARLPHFRDYVQEAGGDFDVYESESNRREPLFDIERAGASDAEPIAKWLVQLRKPVGLMACHDVRGQQIINVCRQLGIAVPDDLGVIGVDDDDTICPLSASPLSSVQPDADGVGYLAAETLDAITKQRHEVGLRSAKIRHVPPVRVVQRESTEVFAVEDRELARVCRFIRRNACKGINVTDVVEYSNLSRRQLERRFRNELQCTPREEITRVQIRRIKRLLSETDMPLERIAQLVGYSHTENVSVIFRRETGQTPGAFRRQATG